METDFSINQYDNGSLWDTCILLHVNDAAILRFKSLAELRDFATQILGNTIPEIVKDDFNQLSEEDQAEFDPC